MDLFGRKEIARLSGVVHDKEILLKDLTTLNELIREECDRKIRETDHKVGLVRKSHELELDEVARRAVRDLEKQLVEEKTHHIAELLATINKYHNEIISRLPTVHVDKVITRGETD